MKQPENWHRDGGYPLPPSPDAPRADDAAARQRHWPPGYREPVTFSEPAARVRRKKKWVAGMLAFIIPGTGHMYLGLMMKGITLMMLIALDITAIVHVSSGSSTLPVVLLSLLLPIIYFYNLFDAIQSTDAVNDRTHPQLYGYRAGWGQGPASSPAPYPASDNWEQASPHAAVPPQGHGSAQPHGPAQLPPQPQPTGRNLPPVGIMIIAGAGVLILLMSGSGWTNWLFHSAGSVFGAIVLIGAGIGFWFWENRGQKGSRT
ncbi:hypothetical protein [Cohnella hongkongensis]|uniref:TM2 domain-containing protein n=1 Tax=Cohnella hongkongensis TaxID=178337 RepID=A0ABV9FKX9_9BACL